MIMLPLRLRTDGLQRPGRPRLCPDAGRRFELARTGCRERSREVRAVAAAGTPSSESADAAKPGRAPPCAATPGANLVPGSRCARPIGATRDAPAPLRRAL